MIHLVSEVLGPGSEEEFLRNFGTIRLALLEHDIMVACATEVLVYPPESEPRPYVVTGHSTGRPPQDGADIPFDVILDLARLIAGTVDSVVQQFRWMARTRIFAPAAGLPNILPPASINQKCQMPNNIHRFNTSDIKARYCPGGHVFSADHHIDNCPIGACARKLLP